MLKLCSILVQLENDRIKNNKNMSKLFNYLKYVFLVVIFVVAFPVESISQSSPILSVEPVVLDYGLILSSLEIKITNTGSGSLIWETAENPDEIWISIVGSASGTLEASESALVQVEVERSSLPDGTHYGEILITSNVGEQPVDLIVEVGDYPTSPEMKVDPHVLDFNIGLDTLTFMIKNRGINTLYWNAYENPEESWLTSISPLSGSLLSMEDIDVTVTVDRSSLNPGNYSSLISINSNAGNDDIEIEMIVGDRPDEIRANVGGSSYIAINNDVFSTDRPYHEGAWGHIRGHPYQTSANIYNTADDELYQTERYWLDGYKFDFSNGSYTVILHFAEIYYDYAGGRVFDTFIEDQLVLDDFDIYTEVGFNTAATYTFSDVQVADGRLDIRFEHFQAHAKLSAIEVISTTPANRYSIEGAISYYSEIRPVSETILNLTDIEGSSNDTTGINGIYVFENIAAGLVELVPSKEGDQREAITGSDALLVLHYLAFITSLTTEQYFASDVTEDGNVTGSDAMAILRYLAFYTNNIGSTGQWRFEPSDTTFNLSENATANFQAFLLGDANGDWNSGSGGANSTATSPGGASSLKIGLKVGEINVLTGQKIEIPLKIEKVNEPLQTLILSVDYDSVLLQYQSAEKTVLSENFILAANGSEPGKVHIAMAGVNGIFTNGDILRLGFEVKDISHRYNNTRLKITRAIINDIKLIDCTSGGANFSDTSLSTVPAYFGASHNYPNPFNPTTTISFELRFESKVKIKIFNMLGQQVAMIFNSDLQAGNHQFSWNAIDPSGKILPSGVYFYRIEIQGNSFKNRESIVLTKKMVLIE